jgi:AmiR/NasT family two-component response regulator
MIDKPLEQLTRMDVTLHCALDGEGQGLLRHLQRTRATVRHHWPAPVRIGEVTDLVLCEYDPDLAQRLAWAPGEPVAALIVLLPQEGRIDLGRLRAACPDAALHRPYQARAIDVALMSALDHFGFGKRMRQRVERMAENIHALRDIERAKHQIMVKNQVSEAKAFQLLRDMAMQRRETVAAIAAKLVDSIDIPS